MVRSHTYFLPLILAGLMILAGCGQKGALYLPEKAAEQPTEKQQTRKSKQ